MKARWAVKVCLLAMAFMPFGVVRSTSVALAKCAVGAALHYQMPVALVHAVMRQEGGRPGFASQNTNGTEDIGPMQINSIHLGELYRYGISRQRLQSDGCLNIYIGTWILKREIVKAGNMWVGVGNYHSHTPALNAKYQWLVWDRLKQLK
jgi:soluble lytic murein transglycosylase-like protein